MSVNVNVKSLVIGFLLGIVMMLVLGAASNPGAGKYQVAVSCSPSGHVIFARVDTITGEVVAWREGDLSMPAKPSVYLRAR
jgi:purine-cytosine permease-like protein